MRVGFIGLGNMGGPLARRLVQRHQLTVHDRRPEMMQGFIDEGATGAASPAELAANCEIVLTCLPTSAEVREVIFGGGGLLEGLQPGAMVADMTTGDPAQTREMAQDLADKGLQMIDAPVSGGPRGANEGTIAIMVGAPDDLFQRVRPVLESISSNVLHAGDVGAGHAIKAGNNLLNLVCRLASFEVVSMLVKNGVAPDKAVGVIQKSSGRSYATEITLPDNILSGKMFQGFTLALMRKDSSLALDIGRASDVPMPFGNLAREMLQGAINEHGLEDDMSALALTYERLTGARIRPAD
ncbi:MAG: NAD(P)-dependent oxidoreductase [Alphaproteobacteria bacterium]|nr:NAD(P)-dependent oxidoreductase [Alphaproteobacteria bacterium]